MAAVSVSRVSCCQLRPPAPSREAGDGGGRATTAARPLLRRACVAAAACVVVAGAINSGGGAAIAVEMAGVGGRHVDAAVVVMVVQRAPVARWSDRRQCPPWHANSLENIVPENLPRPYARRGFNGVKAPALDGSGAAASPDAVVLFLALRSGMGCFSL